MYSSTRERETRRESGGKKSREQAQQVTISTGELYASDFTAQQTVASAAWNGNASRSYNQPQFYDEYNSRELTVR